MFVGPAMKSRDERACLASAKLHAGGAFHQTHQTTTVVNKNKGKTRGGLILLGLQGLGWWAEGWN